MFDLQDPVIQLLGVKVSEKDQRQVSESHQNI